MTPDAALDEAPPENVGEDEREFHKTAMERFRAAVEPQLEVRALSLAARRFVGIPGAQWDGAFGDEYGDTIKLEINKVGRAVRKLETDYRQNRIVPDFRPSGGSSDNDTADTLDGLHRADSQYFKAQQARDNAFSEAARGGFGAYRLTTEYASPLDPDDDAQRINPGLVIPDADQCVFFDPDSKLYDKSDARFAFVLTAMSPAAFKDRWDEKRVVSWEDTLIKPTWDGFDWYHPDTVVQAEYYFVEEKTEALLIFTLEETSEEERHWARDIKPEAIKEYQAMGWKKRTRKVPRRRVMKAVLSGAEVLSAARRIAGERIPIVPVYCYRDYVDGVERFKGIVQDRIDPQRLYNAQTSRLAEIAAMSPFERPIFDPEQLPPALQNLWARGNIDRHPYALANALRDGDGKIVQVGPIGKVEPPSVPQTMAALLEISNRDLTEDDQDGADEVVANTSADAMDTAAARVDAKSGMMLDNMRQSVQCEGEIYLGMAPETYWEEGRVVETMTEEGDDGSATLHERYYDGEILKTRNDFSNGRYKVMASVTEATVTRRDRTVKQMLNVAQIAIAAQDMAGAQAAVGVATLNMDGEGLDDYLEWQRKRGIEAGYVKPSEDEQRELAEAAQNQQPDPAQEVAAAQIKALEAGAVKDVAQAQAAGITAQAQAAERIANAHLKTAQANAVGGPEQAPEVPTGLQAANDEAAVIERRASADLKTAQAEKIRDEIRNPRIRMGRDL